MLADKLGFALSVVKGKKVIPFFPFSYFMGMVIVGSKGKKMIPNLALTSDQVKQSVAAVKERKPDLAGMLDFYGRIFVAQEESKHRHRIEPPKIAENIRSIRLREKLPLIEIKEFEYDKNEARRLFILICGLAKEDNPSLAGSARILLDALAAGLAAGELFAGLLNGDEALFENVAAELGVEKPVLGFIVYHSLKPSLSICADQLSANLNRKEPWQKGCCPVCGSPPILSSLEGDGSRHLFCSFCWQRWAVKRIFCPFCETSDQSYLHYLFGEEDKDVRVDLCDNCNKYIKTIDLRSADRLIYPPLEQIATLHLDFKAKEEGFDPGIRLYMDE